ncbi:DUF1684 domain-containing protein [Bifidobacterium sp. ESL0764]|uniref:DUF1684 domain-containing protein n=1 Tax=Bifidobacterium sp. ESL0764 TaxID=2983228 RepID=UPI0023F8E070|nr:DUF1684 domain-containing protein [Bifidobacterium sp. ESL0764]WEV66398.1 DUF1684 domain-containing protein [Bifidobacterium sp. ESL0764]
MSESNTTETNDHTGAKANAVGSMNRLFASASQRLNLTSASDELAEDISTLPAVAADPYAQQWQMWHEQRLEELKAPHGYLAPASITWVANGSTQAIDGIPGVWRAENDVLTYYPQYKEARSQAVVGKDREEPRAVTNGRTVLEAPISFAPSAFGEQALAYLNYGDKRIEVNSQTDLVDQSTHRFWIRVKDPHTLARQHFDDIDTFPLDPEWRIPAVFRRAEPDEFDIHDSVVKTVLQSYPLLGFVEFRHEGEDYSLVVSNVFGHASIFFKDPTNGRETYGIGRVLRLDELGLDELDVLDFNYAYNYPCAFSAYCTCPIPSKRNTLPFAVRAGEKAPNVDIGW